MAYQPTGLTKGLIAVVALGLIGSVSWNFFLKEKFKAYQENQPIASVAVGGNASPTPAKPAAPAK